MAFLTEKTYESILLFLGISVAAYCGAYIRVGIGYYEIWRIETNYCVMYTQMIGCFIMGFMLQHRSYLFVNSHCIALRVFYTAIASGLCGSITTFSTWSAECNKSFYLQWDLGWGNDQGSYNGGRFFEWITCMTAGIAIPMVALHFGQFCALYTNYNEEKVKIYVDSHTFRPASRSASRSRVVSKSGMSPGLNASLKRSAEAASGNMSPGSLGVSGAVAANLKASIDSNRGAKLMDKVPKVSPSIKALPTEASAAATGDTITLGISAKDAAEAADGVRVPVDPLPEEKKDSVVRTSVRESAVNSIGSSEEADINGTWADINGEFGVEDDEDYYETGMREERTMSVSYEPYEETERKSSRNSVALPSPVTLLSPTSAKSDYTRVGHYFVMEELWWAELLIVVAFVVITALVVVLPAVLSDHSFIFLTYTAVLGAAGAYLRYRFSLYNGMYPNFPVGTFAANILGTWLLAGFTAMSKYSVDYNDVGLQALMYGLITGFCGCLTTISTLVSEVDKLPSKHSYVYAITTNMVAQLGLVLFLNVPSVVTISSSIMASTSINYCQASSQLCSTFLTNIACPTSQQINIPCSSPNSFSSVYGEAYGSVCECGTLNTTRTVRRLVGSLAGANSTSFRSAWPRDALSSTEPTSTIDYCSTASNICADYLTQIGCKPQYWNINSCQRQGLLQVQNTCACGTLSYPGEEVLKVTIAKLLFGRYDMLPYVNYPTSEPINFCEAFSNICTRVLDHFNAPTGGRSIDSCTVSTDYSTFVGTCSVGNLVVGSYIAQNLMDALVVPNAAALLIEYSANQTSAQLSGRRLGTFDARKYESKSIDGIKTSASVSVGAGGRLLAAATSAAHWDACASYVNYCDFFLAQIACPSSLRQVSACGGVTPLFPYGRPQYSAPVCTCGGINSLSSHLQDLFTDQMINQQLNNDYLIISTADPYTLTVSSSAFSQITRSNPPGPI